MAQVSNYKWSRKEKWWCNSIRAKLAAAIKQKSAPLQGRNSDRLTQANVDSIALTSAPVHLGSQKPFPWRCFRICTTRSNFRLSFRIILIICDWFVKRAMVCTGYRNCFVRGKSRLRNKRLQQTPNAMRPRFSQPPFHAASKCHSSLRGRLVCWKTTIEKKIILIRGWNNPWK